MALIGLFLILVSLGACGPVHNDGLSVALALGGILLVIAGAD